MADSCLVKPCLPKGTAVTYCDYDNTTSTGLYDKIEAPTATNVTLNNGQLLIVVPIISVAAITPVNAAQAIPNPVSTADFAIAAGGTSTPGSWGLAVSYQSNSGQTGVVGPFKHNRDTALRSNYDGGISLLNADFSIDDFEPGPSEGIFVPTGSAMGILTQLSNPDRFVLTGADGTTTVFNGFNNSTAPGRPTLVTDRFGNSQTLNWSNQGGQPILTSVTDSYGHTATYRYSDSINTRLIEVTDSANRTVCFQYDDDGRLVAIIGPRINKGADGNTFPDGLARVFAYDVTNRRADQRNNLIAMWAPNEATPFIKPGECAVDMARLTGAVCVDKCGAVAGTAVKGPPVPVMQVRYGQDPTDVDTYNKVVEKIDGDPSHGVGGSTTFMYITDAGALPPNIIDPGDSILLRAIVTDRNGNQSIYDMNESGMAVHFEVIATRNKNSLESHSYVTWTKYNAQNQPVEIVFPEGNTIQFEYETGIVAGISGVYYRRRGLLLRMTRLPGNTIGIPNRPGSNGQELLTERYFHEPLFGLLCASIKSRGNPVTLAGAYFPPQNGGTTPTNADRRRYATMQYFDYQKNNRATVTSDATLHALLFPGLSGGDAAAEIDALITHVNNQLIATDGSGGLPDGFQMALGDINGDGTGDAAGLPPSNNLGRVLKVRNPSVRELHESDGSDPWEWVELERVELFTVNNRGQVTTRTDPEGNVTATLRYPFSNPEGNSALVISSMGNKQYGFIREVHVDVDPFDVMNLIGADGDLRDFTLMVYPRSTRTNTPGVYQDLITRYEAGGSGGCPSCAYDALGNPLASTDPRGFTTRFERNELGEVYRQTAPQPYSFKVEIYFDANRNVTRVDTEDQVVMYASNDPASADYGMFIPSGSGSVANVPMTVGSGGAARPGWFTNLYVFDILNDKIEEDIDATGSFPASLISRFEYDPNQNLIRIIKPEGNLVEFDYDERNLRIATRIGYDASADEPGSVTVSAYDKNGNLESNCGPAQRGTDDNSQTATLSDAFGSGEPFVHTGDWVVKNIYDGFDRLIQSINAVGGIAEFTYDPDARVIAQQISGTIGGSTPVNRLGAANQVLSQSHSRFNEAGWGYEEQQQIFVALRTPVSVAIRVIGGGLKANATTDDHTGTSLLSGGTPIEGLGPITDSYVISRRVFDRSGRTVLRASDNTTRTSVQFDGANRQIRVTDPLSNVFESTYDGNSNLIRSNSIQKADFASPSEFPLENFEGAMRYDALNRLIVAVESAADGTLSSDLNNVSTRFTLWGFDSRGNITASIDPKGNTAINRYDGASRAILSVQHLREAGQGSNGPIDGGTFLPDGGASIIVSTVYDGNSRVTRLIDDRGAVTTYEYDTLDRRVKVIYNDGATFTNVYNEASDVIEFTDANGSVIQSIFNCVGENTEVAVTRGMGVIGPIAQALQYDGLSRLQELAQVNPPSIAYFLYDSLSRRVVEKQQLPVSGSVQAQAYNEWTSLQPTRFTYPDSREVKSSYDALYRLKNIHESVSGGSIASWNYIGPRVAETLLGCGKVCTTLDNARSRSAVQAGRTSPGWGNRSSDRLGYDGGGRLITKRYIDAALDPDTGAYADTSAITGFSTEYDKASNKLYERELHSESRSHLYEPFTLVGSAYVPKGGFDSVNRLRQYQRGVLSSTVGLDAQGGGAVTTPITLSNTDSLRTYNLDGMGNWRKTDSVAAGSTTLVSQARQHNYLNEITRAKTGATVENFSYDGNGNLINDGVRKYKYDAFNRLTEIYRIGTPDVLLVTYSYDGLNRRLSKVIAADATTEYSYFGWRCMQDIDGTAAVLKQYVWGLYLDELIQQKNVTAIHGISGATYPMQDLLYRTTGLLMDNAGSIYVGEAYDTDAYGNTLIFRNAGTPPAAIAYNDSDTQVSDPTCEFIFTGQRLDAETGLYYCKNRYYSAELGRFLTRDPAGYINGFNLFLAYFIPKSVDPLGLYLAEYHTKLTEESLKAAGLNLNGDCWEWVLKTLVDSNLGQDSDKAAFDDLRRHFNRYKPYKLPAADNQDEFTEGFKKYITEEVDNYNSELSSLNESCVANQANREHCNKAIQALGRVTHTWQDYYAHAVQMDGSREAWSATPAIKGSPDDPTAGGKLKPSSWNSWRDTGEHGKLHPLGKEGDLRKADASSYVADQYKKRLPDWIKKCACCCPKAKPKDKPAAGRGPIK